MCFSPEASFTAGIAVAIIGIMTLRKVKFRKELVLASIPLLFASQQLIEGFLWLVLLKGQSPMPQYWLTSIYISYAYVVWPTIVPLSIFLIEPDRNRRNALKTILFMGMGVSIYSLILITGPGISAQIINYCIAYSSNIPQASYNKWIYVMVTCMPFFLSSSPLIRRFGIVNVMTFLMSYWIYHIGYVSVWCFFAAITSVLIYFYFSKRNRL